MKIKNRKAILAITFCIILLNGVLTFQQPASAQFEILDDVGKQVELPGAKNPLYHGSSAADAGAAEITSIIFKVIDVVKYLVGSLAVAWLIISGVRLVTAGKDVEKVSESQKKNIFYSIVALLIVIVADQLVKVFFGDTGDVFENEATAKQMAQEGAKLIEGIYGFATKFIGALSVLVIAGSGVGISMSWGNEDTMKKHRNRILWALGALIVVGIAEFVVKEIIFPEAGKTLPNTEKAKILIVKLTNFVSGFISTIAVLVCIYAGYLYATGAANEENTKKAKTLITGAVIGLLIALGAFALVNTVVKLEKSPKPLAPLGAPPPGFEKVLPK